MASVRIPPILRPEAGGNRQVEVDGATVILLPAVAGGSHLPL